MPGEVVPIALWGSPWRVVPVAAYQHDPGDSSCGDWDNLSVEMLRMTSRPQPSVVLRPAALPMSGELESSCRE